MLGRDTPPAPLKRGGWDVVFLFGNEWVECEDSPLERGLKGCVTERGAGWDEIVLLLFGDVAFLGFGWLFLIWVAVLGRDTPPAPLERGGWDADFFVGNEWFVV